MMLSPSKYTDTSKKWTAFPNCTSLMGNSIPYFFVSAFNWCTNLSKERLVPLHIPRQSSIKRFQNLIASTEFRLGFVLQNRIQCRKMSAIWRDRLPPVGMPTLGLKHSSLYETYEFSRLSSVNRAIAVLIFLSVDLSVWRTSLMVVMLIQVWC